MYNLAQFTTANLHDTICAFKKIAEGARTLEEAATQICGFLYGALIDGKNGRKGCVLVRLYKTHPYGRLSPRLQTFARKIMGETPPTPTMKCLTLLGTAGIEPAWNFREQSNGHQAIPLHSVAFIEGAPMFSQLVKQFGIALPAVVTPDPNLILDLTKRGFNLFYVPQAKGSPYIPAQEGFVIPYDVQSVIGFGGMLASGEIIAAILFTQIPVSKEVAEKFRAMGPALAEISAPFVSLNAIFSR